MHRQLRVPRNFLAGVSNSSGEQPNEGQQPDSEGQSLLTANEKLNTKTKSWEWAITTTWLERIAWGTAVFHAVSGVAVFDLWIRNRNSDRPTSQIQRTAVCWSSNMTMTNHIDTEHSFLLNRIDSIALLIVAFFLLSAVGQAAACSGDYVNKIKLNSPQKYRYYEYSVSASLMMISIFMSFGLLDMYLHLCVFFLTFLCMIMGYFADFIRDLASSQSDNSLRSLVVYLHYISWVPMLVPWLILFISVMDLDGNVFSDSCTDIKFTPAEVETLTMPEQTPTELEANLPWFVWVVLFAEVFLFSMFGAVQQWQFSQEFHFNKYMFSRESFLVKNTKFLDKKTEYNVERTGMVTEALFLFLSLTAKLLLGWVIYSQVLVA